MEVAMARGSKKKYTSKQKRKALRLKEATKNAASAARKRSAAHGRPWTNRTRVVGKKAEEVAGKNEVNRVRAKAEERAAGNNARSPYRRNIAPAAMNLIAAVIPTSTCDNQNLGW